MDKNITYESAGVNLQSSEKIKNKIKDLAKQTYNPNVIGGVGGFGAMYKISGYREPILVSSTDPVGTKLMVAGMIGDYSHIGEDLVNACINDLIVVGAEPLFFLDYIATSQMIPSVVETIVGGISEACKNVGCALIGGETSEMPGVFNESNFDISGFVVGAVEADQMLDPINTSKAGDLLIGLPSNGLHTNGYSLVRHVFNLPNDLDILEEKTIESGETLGQALLKPHPSYYEDLKKVFPVCKGIAHITGGGLYENMPRILPNDIQAEFDASLWDMPSIFHFIEKTGSIDVDEMYRVFNMGLGMVIICTPENASEILKSATPEEALKKELTQTFFPHGLGHMLGLQVHDVGGLQKNAEGDEPERRKDYPNLRAARPLRSHEVITIEPGLYFIPLLLEEAFSSKNKTHYNQKLCSELITCGGIRIEDNLLVNEKKSLNLTRLYL